MLVILILLGILCRLTSQLCPEELIDGENNPTWYNSENTELCQNESSLTNNCSDPNWYLASDYIQSLGHNADESLCPPGQYSITDSDHDYCYHIGKPSIWNSPCYTSGSASVITDLSTTEVEYLLHSLTVANISRYFWLPASRQKMFNPVVWSIPGPNWRRRLTPNNSLQTNLPIMKNCLLLDIDQRMLVTESCSKIYPSLCFYKKQKIGNQGTCPEGYLFFSFRNEKNKCFGIEKSDSIEGMSFEKFLENKCPKPMKYSNNPSFMAIFRIMSELHNISNNDSCWVQMQGINHEENICNSEIINSTLPSPTKETVINAIGGLHLVSTDTSMTCMACEADMLSDEITEFMFEYNALYNQIYLTVYFPSGLWKYGNYDKGIQCFSDAKGFVKVVDVNDYPLIDLRSNTDKIDKVVYLIDLVTDSFARYWCEGHTFNFSLITTEKLVVSPKGNKIHVFSLVMKIYDQLDDFNETLCPTIFLTSLKEMFNAETVLLMDFLEYTTNYLMVLLHLHVTIDEIYTSEARNIQYTYLRLKYKAETEFPKHHYVFINMSSSIYCLPNATDDVIILEWELTPIGSVTAPKQFCLQANGLPVRRRCLGSYMLGSYWDSVDGMCDTNYTPTETTTFLYNFVKEPSTNDSKFLTEGLSFVLDDTDVIIPADIYYLSVSLKKVISISDENECEIDTGNIDNIAWIMDRVMVIDHSYLGLAQTLNSTNVIIDSVTDIIEIIIQKNLTNTPHIDDYQIAVQPQFLVQVSYPEINNITGIAVIKTTSSDSLTDMIIKPLYKNTSLHEIASVNNIEIATWLPSQVLETIRNNISQQLDEDGINKHFHIIITVFNNNAMFQEPTKDMHRSTTPVIGITIPGYYSNLEYPISLLFKHMNATENTYCGYWDFHSMQANDVPGTWKKRGCYMVDFIEELKICECYHLTHFGQLLYNPNSNIDEVIASNRTHNRALNIITLVGSFLSLLGVVGIWLTAFIFTSWRKKPGTKVLLQLSTSISLPLLLIIVFNLDDSMFTQEDKLYSIAEHKRGLCIVLGALFHFSILASFMWMLITAILQFIRYVRVLGVRRPSRFMFKFTLIGWGIPLVPVLMCLTLRADNYIPDPSLIRRICYPKGIYLIATVLLPIFLILSVNIVLFILVLYAISRGSGKKTNCTDIDLVTAQLRVSIFLFFLLGLTWIFGIFSFTNNLMWSYLFCLTSTIQGFVLFIYFVICDPNTRTLWITLMKPQFSTNSCRNSISNISTG